MKRIIYSLSFLYSIQSDALVEINAPLQDLYIQIEEADIENGVDVSSTVDFCLYSDLVDAIKGDGLFRIKYASNTGINTVVSVIDSNFSLPYTISVALGAGQTSNFTNLTEGTYTSNDTPLALGSVPFEPCSTNDVPNMTLQMTIPGNALASARAGPYGGSSTLTLTVEEPTL
jgi:hypothetical protein